MSRSTVVHAVYGEKLAESAKAIKWQIREIQGIYIYELGEPVKIDWFPFSQVSKSFTSPDKKDNYLIVSEWILEQKGFMTPTQKKNYETYQSKKEQNYDLLASDGRAEKREEHEYTDDNDEDDIPF